MALTLDELLPELPSVARLLIARDLTGESEILAIDLDSKRQVGVDTHEAYNFIPDMIGLTPNCAAIYNQGRPVATGMAIETWALWLEGCEFVEDPGFVWLTCSKDGDSDNCISAVCLTDSREVIAPPAELRAFLTDLIGFNPNRFEQGLVSSAGWPQAAGRSGLTPTKCGLRSQSEVTAASPLSLEDKMKTLLLSLALAFPLAMVAAGSATAQTIPASQNKPPATYDQYPYRPACRQLTAAPGSAAGWFGWGPTIKASIRTGEALRRTYHPSKPTSVWPQLASAS